MCCKNGGASRVNESARLTDVPRQRQSAALNGKLVFAQYVQAYLIGLAGRIII